MKYQVHDFGRYQVCGHWLRWGVARKVFGEVHPIIFRTKFRAIAEVAATLLDNYERKT